MVLAHGRGTYIVSKRAVAEEVRDLASRIEQTDVAAELGGTGLVRYDRLPLLVDCEYGPPKWVDEHSILVIHFDGVRFPQ
ncbi:MAG: hypothetical protein AAGA56_02750 [Myxococcota bacterium]